MRKITLIAHISLDGFVAGEHGELKGFDAGEENLQFVAGLTKHADCALLGRKSYQMMDPYWSTANNLPDATAGTIAYSTWYNNANKIVISKTLAREKKEKAVIISDNIIDEISKIKNKEGKDILIFGSPSIAQLLLPQRLINDYWIFINPVLFGTGIPLFVTSSNKANFKLVSTKHFANGELAMHFV
ncbi:MAG: dihydrofolate reductase [Bacteroidetes bacterium]|nr:dihydrofolate reductase [Bacteroidota bacterium]